MKELEKQKLETIENLKREGRLKSKEIIEAMLKVKRELFVLPEYKNEAWLDTPLPIVSGATISAPHIYAIMLEAVKLKPGEKVLEIGSGSGYGAALIKEIVKKGKVITIEINPEVYEFAKNNLKKAGYKNIKVVLGDGSLGYEEEAPYDAIISTAAAPKIPKPWIDQLKEGGRLISPVITAFGQELIYLEKKDNRIKTKNLGPVVFLELLGKYGKKVKNA
jgi:protein-L-isoaspartate(D-aspartate) O-methyltransferase